MTEVVLEVRRRERPQEQQSRWAFIANFKKKREQRDLTRSPQRVIVYLSICGSRLKGDR